jgi:hypothetical protein
MNKKLLSSRTEHQRQRLLDYLKQHGSISTVQARRDLDIMMPAARVFELRHLHGETIPLFWQVEETRPGHKHRIGLYVYIPKEMGGSK